MRTIGIYNDRSNNWQYRCISWYINLNIYISTVSRMILFTHNHIEVSICSQWIKGFNVMHTPDHKLNRLIISDKYYSLHNQDYLDINYANLLFVGWSYIVSFIFANYRELMTRASFLRTVAVCFWEVLFLVIEQILTKPGSTVLTTCHLFILWKTLALS